MPHFHSWIPAICALLAAVLSCAGCATPTMQTKSGRPEVTIQASPDEVKGALESELINRGYLVKDDSGPIVMAEKDAGTAAQIFSGTPSFRPQIRARFNVIKMATGTRVIGSLFMTSPGFRQENDFNRQRSNIELQYMLDCIAADLGIARDPNRRFCRPRRKPLHRARRRGHCGSYRIDASDEARP